MPILDIQRRAVEAGRIRAGDKDDRGNPRRGKNWRLTSRDEVRLVAASKLWGGKVKPWEARPGEFELYTSTDVLPILLLPRQLPTTWYELWSAGGCQRRCDGRHETVGDQACVCNPDDRECSPHTRLSVMLPDLPGIGAWLLQSTGWYAASELAGVSELLQWTSAQGILVPARLILEQREDKKPGKPNHKYVVPVIDVEPTMRDIMGMTTAGALPAGEPIAATPATLTEGGVSVADGLDAVQRERVALPRANAAEPIGPPIATAPGASPDAPDEESEDVTGPPDTVPSAEPGVPSHAAAGTGLGDDVPVPASSDDRADAGAEPQAPDDPVDVPNVAGDAAAGTSGDPPPPPRPADIGKKLSADQRKFLNALYGQLKVIPTDGAGNVTGNPAVTIGGLYAWAAKQRKLDVDDMIELLNESAKAHDKPLARDDNGKLHFPALRDSLSRGEAHAMIEGMIGIKDRVEAAS